MMPMMMIMTTTIPMTITTADKMGRMLTITIITAHKIGWYSDGNEHVDVDCVDDDDHAYNLNFEKK